MKKFFVGALAIFLLTSCGNNNEDEINTNDIFKEELAIVSEIENASGKLLFEELLVEEIENIFNEIFGFAIFETSSIEIGEMTQGAGSDGNGGRIFCSKLPVEVQFTGTEASIEKFVEYFNEFENVVSFGEFNIEPIEDGKYKVNTLVTFLGKEKGGSLGAGKAKFVIKQNEVKVEEEKNELRDFDISMVIRPNNSDFSAITLGVFEDKDYRVYGNGNSKKQINVTFSNEGSKYFCEYSIGDDSSTKVSINPKGNILFDILSCDVDEADDKIGADLYINNKSNKKVSIVTYRDKDDRVKLIEKTGNVEVSKK